MAITSLRSKILSEGTYINYSISNPFYLYCQEYYRDYYSGYLAQCLQLYDGSLQFKTSGTTFSNQMFASTIGNGLVRKLFANGIDFSCSPENKLVMNKWAKQTHLLKELEKGWKYAYAGGTSLIKLNRSQSKKLFITTHRIDTFYADCTSNGEIQRVLIYQDLIHETSKSTEEGKIKSHYMLVEERKFNEMGQPIVKHAIYNGTYSLQTNNNIRPTKVDMREVSWTELPRDIRKVVKDRYPSIIVGKEMYLPFPHDLGCRLWSWTTDNPRIPDFPFGQPVGDLLQSECRQYDQLKAFEEWEVKMARAKATLPSEYMNQDDPARQETAMEDNFFTKIDLMNDSATIERIQFNLRASDIRTQKENILRDTALKIGVSASTIASFLNEGAGAKTATEIVNEKTHTDTFIKDQINLIKDDLNDLMCIVSRYLDCIGDVELIFRSENQSSHIDTMKIYSDAFNSGIISPERYVNDVFGYLSQEEKAFEISYMKQEVERRNQMKENEIQQQLAQTTALNEYAPLREEDKPSVGGMKQKISEDL